MPKSAVLDRADEDRPTARPRGSRSQGSGGSGGSGGPLERVTVNLIARASRALQRVADRTGDSKTDIINRALQVYGYLEDVSADGGAIYVRETKDSEPQLLKMFL
jgi:hypothetical protein